NESRAGTGVGRSRVSRVRLLSCLRLRLRHDSRRSSSGEAPHQCAQLDGHYPARGGVAPMLTFPPGIMVAEGKNVNGSSTGHRERLRQRFSEAPVQLTDAQRLELLLTFAIPRRDVAPLADRLIQRFGSLDQVLSASRDELHAVEGV